MKALHFYVVLLLLFLVTSCDPKKKKYPEPEVITNSAVYYSRITINNTPMVLEAGIDGYYMYSSVTKDSLTNLNRFTAEIAPENCQNCPKSLKVQINDYKVSTSLNIKLDSSLRVDKYPYLMGNFVPSYSVQYHSVAPATSYTWSFGDNTTSYEASPYHVFQNAATYNVCLTTRNSQCISSICNKEKINTSTASCKTAIKVTSIKGDTISFSDSTVFGQPPYQWFWSFGDGTTSTKRNPVCAYKYRGSYPVSLLVVDYYGDTARANYNVKTQYDYSSCTANFYKTSIKQVAGILPLSAVVITWVDSDGTVYSSNNKLQPSDGLFEILSVTEGDINEKQQPTKKLSVRFKCKLFNGSQSINVDNAEAIICVAYNK